jgi:hypothetical protein
VLEPVDERFKGSELAADRGRHAAALPAH